jgi:hypothetical protein
VNIVFCAYFLVQELSVLYGMRSKYFKVLRNVFKFTTLLIFLTVIVLYIYDNSVTEKFGYSLTLAVCSIFMWNRSMLIMQLSDSTSVFIEMIANFYRARLLSFCILALIIFAAFADAFTNISQRAPEEFKFIHSFVGSIMFSYFCALGETSGIKEESFGGESEVLYMIMFIGDTILTSVLILNLLIGVVNTTYLEAQAQQEVSSFRTKASLVRTIWSENSLKKSKISDSNIQNHLLLVCIEKPTIMPGSVDVLDLSEKISNHKSSMDEVTADMTKAIKLMQSKEKLK